MPAMTFAYVPPPRLTHDSWPFLPVGADEAERKAARLVSWLLAVFPRSLSAAIAKATFTSEALLMHSRSSGKRRAS